MSHKILDFVEFHKALTISLAVLLSLVGVSFAAVPDLGSYFFKSEETITSVDNSAIINADLDNLDHNLKINSLRENSSGYEIGYSHDTLGIADGFWQKISLNKTVSVDRSALVNESLGKYVAGKIVDDLSSEIAHLKLIQANEQSKGLTQKVVTTTYSGVIGGFFDETIEVVDNTAPPSPSNSSGSSLDGGTIEDIIEDLLQNLNDPNPTPSPTAPPNPTGTPQPTPTPTPSILPTPAPLPTPPPPPAFISAPPGFYFVPTPPNYVPQPDSVSSGPANY